MIRSRMFKTSAIQKKEHDPQLHELYQPLLKRKFLTGSATLINQEALIENV